MKERLKVLRNTLGLSQAEFSTRISISQALCAQFESGKRVPRDIHINQICLTFNVSENWLRNGEGTMFVEHEETATERLVKKYSFPQIVGKLLTAYEGLEQEQQEAVLEYAQRFITSIIDDTSDIDRKVEAYRQELLAEKKAADESSASQTGRSVTG